MFLHNSYNNKNEEFKTIRITIGSHRKLKNFSRLIKYLVTPIGPYDSVINRIIYASNIEHASSSFSHRNFVTILSINSSHGRGITKKRVYHLSFCKAIM